YIIIDGGSTDGTIDIVNKYKDRISVIVSEKDKGIYDAMNKGVTYATGKWVNFMNAGDLFADSNVLYNVFDNKKYADNVGIIYGGTIYDFGNIGEIRMLKKEDMNKNHCTYNHQSMFLLSKLCKQYPFDLKFKMAGDYYQIHTILNNGQFALYVPYFIAIYDEYGISSHKLLLLFKECHDISGRKKNVKYYVNYIKYYLKSLIPLNMYNKYKFIHLQKLENTYSTQSVK
ncbi:MAG: glycosyltransferase, partial [Bacteroidales bacterium]|nr:glycosyltransferase [Bacteroidales bacterium]